MIGNYTHPRLASGARTGNGGIRGQISRVPSNLIKTFSSPLESSTDEKIAFRISTALSVEDELEDGISKYALYI